MLANLLYRVRRWMLIRRARLTYHLRTCDTAYRGCDPACPFQPAWDEVERLDEEREREG
jgi:hypothetical protein